MGINMKLTKEQLESIREDLICVLWFIAGMAVLSIGLKIGIITLEML